MKNLVQLQVYKFYIINDKSDAAMRIVLYESHNHNPVVDINTEIKALGSVETAFKSFINKTQTAIF